MHNAKANSSSYNDKLFRIFSNTLLMLELSWWHLTRLRAQHWNYGSQEIQKQKLVTFQVYRSLWNWPNFVWLGAPSYFDFIIRCLNNQLQQNILSCLGNCFKIYHPRPHTSLENKWAPLLIDKRCQHKHMNIHKLAHNLQF